MILAMKNIFTATNICFIEWPEMITELLPGKSCKDSNRGG